MITVSAETALEILVGLDVPAREASADLDAMSAHVNCAGHTVFLPEGGTLGIRALADGRFAVAI